jgi:hypothetical protein
MRRVRVNKKMVGPVSLGVVKSYSKVRQVRDVLIVLGIISLFVIGVKLLYVYGVVKEFNW